MGKKYKFRKVYFICEDNKVFAQEFKVVNCYKEEGYCKNVCAGQQRIKMENVNMWWAGKETIPQLTPHGFYLVHESLFDEILKKWTGESK